MAPGDAITLLPPFASRIVSSPARSRSPTQVRECVSATASSRPSAALRMASRRPIYSTRTMYARLLAEGRRMLASALKVPSPLHRAHPQAITCARNIADGASRFPTVVNPLFAADEGSIRPDPGAKAMAAAGGLGRSSLCVPNRASSPPSSRSAERWPGRPFRTTAGTDRIPRPRRGLRCPIRTGAR